MFSTCHVASDELYSFSLPWFPHLPNGYHVGTHLIGLSGGSMRQYLSSVEPFKGLRNFP